MTGVLRSIVLLILAVMLVLPAFAGAQTAVPVPGDGVNLNAPPQPRRDTEPVILRGSDLPAWSARSNQTLRMPLVDLQDCQSFDEQCDHNHYAEPHFDTGAMLGGGIATDRLLGYRYDAAKRSWSQIPFQVDEVFARYLNNSASGFAVYSGEDQHTTYAYEREGFRFTNDGPADDPCRAQQASPTAQDPVAGLDDNDELAFMYSDAGDQMPPGTALPAGISRSYEVLVSDPANQTAPPRYVYVMQAAANGPKPAFDATNGYVSYKRDNDADLYEYSESSYDGYGNAAQGVHCDKDGKVVRNADGTPKIDKRRPRDHATIKTDRYRFRYDGRWLMTQINISSDKGKTYSPDVVDRWKARAFAQDPGSETPCCGFEEEDTNWGGSSTLLGEKVGPVRAIRETWGADSGTNVIRRESFYRYEMRQKTWLRVHVIPPLDGIYAQWDFNAGRMTKFFNSTNPDQGYPIDGQNDELFGNFDDPCNSNWEANETSEIDEGYRSLYQTLPGLCDPAVQCPDGLDPVREPEFQGINPVDSLCGRPYHQSIDAFDPTFSKANVALEWSQTSGPHGSIVDRIATDVRDLTPGGAAQSVVATPYYRDDSCFDDGTGTDPGPKIKLRSGDEPRKAADGSDRKCWRPADGIPDGSDKFFQGSIATHGLHLLFLVDSDNARQTVPLNEIVSDWRMVMLPGDVSVPGPDPDPDPDPGPDPDPDPGPGDGGSSGGSGGGGSGGSGGGGSDGGSSAGQEYGAGFNQPVQPSTQPTPGVADRTKPTVRRLGLRRVRRNLMRLSWSAFDTGGSGLKTIKVQVLRGKKWRTLSTSAKRRSVLFRRTGKGRVKFRIQAVDTAGNRSAWVSRRFR